MSISGASKYEYFIKQGDLEPAIEANLQYADGTPVDVTGKTVTFKWRNRDDDAAAIQTGTATVVDGPTGHVKYDWQTGETDTPGPFYAEWDVVISGARTLTFPNNGFLEFLVVPELA